MDLIGCKVFESAIKVMIHSLPYLITCSTFISCINLAACKLQNSDLAVHFTFIFITREVLTSINKQNFPLLASFLASPKLNACLVATVSTIAYFCLAGRLRFLTHPLRIIGRCGNKIGPAHPGYPDKINFPTPVPYLKFSTQLESAKILQPYRP